MPVSPIMGGTQLWRTLTRRFLQAMQPKRDFPCRLRFRLEIPFISDRSAGGPFILDNGVTTKIDSSAAGVDMENVSNAERQGDVFKDREEGENHPNNGKGFGHGALHQRWIFIKGSYSISGQIR